MSGPTTDLERDDLAGDGRAHSAGRLLAFVHERSPLRVYLTYAVLWVLALSGALHLATPEAPAWRLDLSLAAEVATVWLMLLFGRIVDEQKDLEYDRVHNPGRPLPRGAVSVLELRIAMAAVVVLVLALNAWSHPAATVVLVVDLGYICLLVPLDRLSTRVRDGLFLNLLVSYPVQLMLSVQIWLFFLDETGAGPRWSAPALISMFACVFLHFEFARKTSRRPAPGAHLYSNVVGARGAAALTIGTALAAVLIDPVVLRPWEVSGPALPAAWLPLTALGFVWMGARRFRAAGATVWPAALGMGFLAWFYLGLTVQSLAVGTVDISW
ncbi:hypothetical protein CC117_23285 [Parafrankia colletiae]|uniref:4-hydroxybenzoate polyprenyltransferase-like prenyltransferase n=1 Tax=Parafrankia colletiae TaxID=573497 RepID=A0A1S1QIM5_9ACTN|nr:hypothetical protein [Parafrankia colletiae]MCK9902037.1 hypothetical protein [Frankia sp. Cpl3]OHV33281.1 hypothetical protein CC117_23285 [Parafrankia colletiae]